MVSENPTRAYTFIHKELLCCSEDEFSLLFDVEHSPQRKIRLHKIHLPKRKILDAAFSRTHSIVVFSGSLVYTWGLDHFENAFKTNEKKHPNNKYPVCVNYLRNKNITW